MAEMQQCYSFAGASRGKSDPKAVNYFTVEGECPLDHCLRDDHEHNVLMWTGNEYSRNRTWMTCDEQHTLDLSEMR